MKKTVIKILVLLLTAAMVFSLGITATAVSAIPMSAGSGDLGVFCLSAQVEGKEVSVSAFLMEDDGYVYLVTDPMCAQAFKTADLTLKGADGHLEEALLVGNDQYFTYLISPNLESYECLKRGNNIAESGVQYVNIGGSEISKLDVDLTTAIMSDKVQSVDELVFVMYPPFFDSILGSPLVKTGTKEVFAYCTAYLDLDSQEVYPAFLTIGNAEPNKAYALGADEGSGGNTETQPSGGNSGNDGNDGTNTGNGDEEQGGFEFNPLYLLVIAAAVAVVIILVVRNGNRKDNEASGSAAVVEKPADSDGGSNQMPLKPQRDTAPMNPGACDSSAAAVWQLRAVDGCFKGQTFPVIGCVRLGRTSQCQVVFPAGTPGISSNHCEVTLEGGSVVLRDMGSSYGTFCKGSKLSPNAPCYLNPGDTFTMAQSQTFQLEATGAPAQSNAFITARDAEGNTYQLEVAGASAQSNASITVRNAQGREYRTGSGRMGFGRAAGNKVRFSADDKSVSSNHCVLYRENGKLYLMDVGSTNGTFLSEKECLQPNVPYRIRRGMAFYLANRQNTFVVTED